MASKVAALVRNFLQTDGDALYLVAGEKIFVMKGTARTVAGREVVSEASFRAVVDELVPGVPAETLAEKRNRLPYVAGPGLPAVEIHFATLGGAPAMMILRPGRGGAGEAPRTPAPAPAPLREAPPPIAKAPPREAPGRPAVAPAVPAVPPQPAPAGPRVARAVPGPLEALLSYAREMGASDLLVSPAAPPRLRRNGTFSAEGAAAPAPSEVEAFVATFPPRVAASLAGRGSARLVLETEGAGRCLVRVARERGGTALAVRFLPPEAHGLEALALPESVIRLAAPGPGLLLVAGPPGSGRTTTLAALAARAAQERGERLVTVEDPVEIPIASGRGSVSRREVGSDVPSIRAGLAAAATDDADVVLAGEVPDSASAALLVELAASGRLVLAPAPAPSLALALQWLDARLPDGRRLELRALLAGAFRGGVALALCRGRTGGRVAAAETLHPGSLVSGLVLSGGVAALPVELRDSSGRVPLEASLARLVAAGLVDAREALLRALDRPALVARLRDSGVPLPADLAGGGGGGPAAP